MKRFDTALQGRVVLITGSSSGIGRAAALKFAACGAQTVLAARSVDKLQEVAAEIAHARGVHPLVLALDVRDDAQVEQVVATVYERYGRLDVLVNNAGWGLFQETNDLTMAEVADMMDVNYLGLVRLTKCALPQLLAQGQGHIVNVASMASFFATAEHGVYAATKFAVQGFSEGLRFELAHTGVTVSTVNPGPVDTPFYERADRERRTVPTFARFLSADEVAEAVVRAAVEKKPLYLLPKSGWIALAFRWLFPPLYDRIMMRKKR